MMFNGKKGMIFSILLVVMFIIVMSIAFTAFRFKFQNIASQRELGELQYETLDVIQEPEKALAYVDIAARFAAVKAAYDLAELGGNFRTGCEKKDGYEIWILENSTRCFPDFRKNYMKYFSFHFDPLIPLYNSRATGRITIKEAIIMPVFNYEFLVKNPIGKTLIEGFALQDLEIEKEGTLYRMKPNFEAEIDYDLLEYQALFDKSVSLMRSCYNKTDIEKCVQDEIVEPYNAVKIEDNLVLMEYEGDQIYPDTEKLVYKFGFYIPDSKDKLPMERKPAPILDVTPQVIDTMSQVYAAQQGDLNSSLIKAMIQQESSGDPNALRCEPGYEKNWKDHVQKLNCAKYGCDSQYSEGEWKGYHKVSCSYGLMQLMYPTALEICGDIVTTPESLYNPNINVECGTRYIKKQISYCGSISRGVYAYNHGAKYCKTADVSTDRYTQSVLGLCGDACTIA